MSKFNTEGFVLWFTGLPAAGKTTLAQHVKDQLDQHGIQVVILDSDDLRAVLTPNPTYTEAERNWFYNVITYLAVFLANNRINVLIAATAHRRQYRDRVRERLSRFGEVYVQTSLKACQERDPKGIYALAASGVAPAVPGIGAEYEPPLKPEAAIDTTNHLPKEAAWLVLAQLQDAGIMAINSYAPAS